jgi:hypothetical protein
MPVRVGCRVVKRTRSAPLVQREFDHRNPGCASCCVRAMRTRFEFDFDTKATPDQVIEQMTDFHRAPIPLAFVVGQGRRGVSPRRLRSRYP